MIKAGIMGATGYVGAELIRLLYNHPEVEIYAISSKQHNYQSYDTIYNNFSHLFQMECTEMDLEILADQVDVIFFALPHGVSKDLITPSILKRVKIIDISADFRLENINIYEYWYKLKHNNQYALNKAVYGLTEWRRKEISSAQLVSNPGCYPTCALLCLLPLIKEKVIDINHIIIDAKSGVSGAGRFLNLVTHYPECNESVKAYNVLSHRHTPEIEQELSKVYGKEIKVTFVPHLIPMNRGIFCTCYGILKDNYNYNQIRNIYEKYYQNENFIRLVKKDVFPDTNYVKGSNFCDIGMSIDQNKGKLVIMGVIDNLIKGAAGQAVQNMNIMFSLEESMGLKLVPPFPI